MGTNQLALLGILAFTVAATDTTLKIGKEHPRSYRTHNSELTRVKRGETHEELSRVKRLQDPVMENAMEDNLPKDRLSRVKRIGDDHSNREKRQIQQIVSRRMHRIDATYKAGVHEKARQQSGTPRKQVHKKRKFPKHVGLMTPLIHLSKLNRLQTRRNTKNPIERKKHRKYHRKSC